MPDNLFIEYLKSEPQFFWAVCITVIFSITVHELSHGVAAIALGDRTPIESGHMTPNPLVHMGLPSLIMLLVAGIAWGKMPVTWSELRGRHGRAWVAAAGPLSNVLMAAAALVALGLWMRFGQVDDDPDHPQSLRYLLWVFGYTNVALAIFNLIPVPPLDGSHILADLFPSFDQMTQRMRQSGGMSIPFLLIFLFGGPLLYSTAGKIASQVLNWVSGS